MNLYRIKARRILWHKFSSKILETALKCAVVLSLPVVPSIGIAAFWYYVFYKNDIHFPDGHAQPIAIDAWITTFVFIYGILATRVLDTVWGQFVEMRIAINRRDIEGFMSLRDQDVSPVVHTMMAVLGSGVLIGFMSLEYDTGVSGLIMIGGVAYTLGLIYFVIEQLDNPCEGIWFIKSIDAEWLKIDPRTWREIHYKDIEEEIAAELKKCSSQH